MQTPEQRYRTDPMYAHVVKMLEVIIHKAELTPGEVREAAMLACIHYEMTVGPRDLFIPTDVENAIEMLSGWTKGKEERR